MYFKASMGRSTLIISSLTSMLLIGLPTYLIINQLVLSQQQFGDTPEIWIAILSPLIILLLCFFYRVNGYEVSVNSIKVKRLIGEFDIDLKELKSVTYDPEAMRHSLRTFGNGGLFGFYGRFRNTQHGSYRAFVTNTKQCVVLELSDNKVVISPDSAKELVKKLDNYLASN